MAKSLVQVETNLFQRQTSSKDHGLHVAMRNGHLVFARTDSIFLWCLSNLPHIHPLHHFYQIK